MAEMGWTPMQVYELTLVQLIGLIEAINLRESRDWEKFRQVSYTVAGYAMGRKGRLPKIEKFLPLISDRVTIERDIKETQNRHDLYRAYFQYQLEKNASGGNTDTGRN